MHWMSILGVLFLICGTICSLIGTNRSNEKTKNDLASEIRNKNEKIDTLLIKLEEKESEIRELKQWNNKISIRLLNQVNEKIEILIGTIVSCSNYVGTTDEIDEQTMMLICKNCELDKKTGAKKYISQVPLILGDEVVRENVFNNWLFISKYLDEVNHATTYIHPQVYELILRMQKCSFSISANILMQPTKNKDLEAWSTQIFELYKFNIEIERLIDSLDDED